MADQITNRGKVSLYFLIEGFHFLQLFQLLLVSPIGMSTADHDLGIRKVVSLI